VNAFLTIYLFSVFWQLMDFLLWNNLWDISLIDFKYQICPPLSPPQLRVDINKSYKILIKLFYLMRCAHSWISGSQTKTITKTHTKCQSMGSQCSTNASFCDWSDPICFEPNSDKVIERTSKRRRPPNYPWLVLVFFAFL